MIAAIYSTTTGRIRMFVSGPPSQIPCDVTDGEEFYLNCPTTATHIIDNEPVRIVPEPTPPTEEEIISTLTYAVQNKLDTTAKARNYDGILSLCSYATSTDPVFSMEGQAGVEWRDACWRLCYTVFTDVKNGIKPIPTPEELVASLPNISW